MPINPRHSPLHISHTRPTLLSADASRGPRSCCRFCSRSALCFVYLAHKGECLFTLDIATKIVTADGEQASLESAVRTRTRGAALRVPAAFREMKKVTESQSRRQRLQCWVQDTLTFSNLRFCNKPRRCRSCA